MTFALSGASSSRPTKFAPIFQAFWFQGLCSQRNPLRSSQSHIYDRYYASYDALIDGSNVEISNRLTPIRRYGNSVYNSQTFSDVLSFYSFQQLGTNSEQIDVIVDTSSAIYDGTGPSTQDLIFTKTSGAGQAFFQGVGNTLYFGDGLDQKKWVQTLTTWTASTTYSVSNLGTFIIDTNGNIQQIDATIVPIATVATDSSVPQNVTITYPGGTDLTTVVSDGLTGEFFRLTNATWLIGQAGTITNVTSNSVTFSTNITGHANYGPTSDTGVFTVAQGGNPVSGASEPSWSGTLLDHTFDNTVQWINRGSTIENWGIAAPTTAPTITKEGGGGISWQPNTFYSNIQCIVDSNGNLQNVTTAGVSGSTVPSWATIDGHTTDDGTVVWTQKETSAELTWAASTTYNTGQIIQASAGGQNCLFELQANAYPVFKQVSGHYVTAEFYTHNHGFGGQCELRNPVDGGNNPGSGSYPLLQTSYGTSILFNPPQYNGTTDPNVQPIEWATITGAGNITGYTQPWSGATQNYNMIVTATITIPVAGQYTFTINHDDGMFWGIGTGSSTGQQPTIVSGPNNCPAPQATLTAQEGYQVMGANNVNASGGQFADTYVVNIPAADSYPIEIDYCQQVNNQTLVLLVNNQTPVPGAAETGTMQPVWPAWTTSFAPAYPSVNESNNSGNGNGPLTWNNIGPSADYVWHKTTSFYTTANSTITDPNNYTEDPYRAGVTGASGSEPTFATGINQLTLDNPNLTWINQGPAAAPPVGSLSTFNGGWTYYIALVNTLTNAVSNVGPASASTGDFNGISGVKLTGGLPASIDSQIDYVAIFRTEDGGATPYLIPGAYNTVYTVPLEQYESDGYTDTTLDSGLNILLEAPLDQQNTPPPVGSINLVQHLDRIFFSVGNVVYWTSGPDTPIGNGFEGYEPTNVATFPSLVKRMVPTSVGLFVYTVSDIYLITGNGTSSSPLFPVPYLPGKGIRSYNALAVNGTLTYLFSTASAIMAVDPNAGYYDYGFAIGDQFKNSNWNAANAYLTYHEYGEDVALFVADGQAGWFRGNPTPAPESGSTLWSPFATIVGGVGAIASIETSPGVKQLLLGPTGAGPILARDLTTNADNGSAYSAFFTIGSLVLAQPGQLAEVGFIATTCLAVGTKPSLAVLMDEVSGVFDPIQRTSQDPPVLEPSESLYADRYNLLTTQNGTPALCQHMQIQVSWPPENQPNEMLAMTIYGGFEGDE